MPTGRDTTRRIGSVSRNGGDGRNDSAPGGPVPAEEAESKRRALDGDDAEDEPGTPGVEAEPGVLHHLDGVQERGEA
jgi:hypothetical protein